MSINSFDSRGQLQVGGESFEIFRLAAVPGASRLPFSLKVLLENLLRTEDGRSITAAQIAALAAGTRRPSRTPRSSSPPPG